MRETSVSDLRGCLSSFHFNGFNGSDSPVLQSHRFLTLALEMRAPPLGLPHWRERSPIALWIRVVLRSTPAPPWAEQERSTESHSGWRLGWDTGDRHDWWLREISSALGKETYHHKAEQASALPGALDTAFSSMREAFMPLSLVESRLNLSKVYVFWNLHAY